MKEEQGGTIAYVCNACGDTYHKPGWMLALVTGKVHLCRRCTIMIVREFFYSHYWGISLPEALYEWGKKLDDVQMDKRREKNRKKALEFCKCLIRKELRAKYEEKKG